jgi:hypothetical protein
MAILVKTILGEGKIPDKELIALCKNTPVEQRRRRSVLPMLVQA